MIFFKINRNRMKLILSICPFHNNLQSPVTVCAYIIAYIFLNLWCYTNATFVYISSLSLNPLNRYEKSICCTLFFTRCHFKTSNFKISSYLRTSSITIISSINDLQFICRLLILNLLFVVQLTTSSFPAFCNSKLPPSRN